MSLNANESEPLINGDTSKGGDYTQQADTQDAKSPTSSGTASPRGPPPPMRRFMKLTSYAIAVTVFAVWTGLLTSGLLNEHLTNYTPENSCIDVIFVDVIRSVIVVVSLMMDREWTLLIGQYWATLSLLLLLGKPWVYRAWGSHPACTASLVLAVLSSLAHFLCARKILKIDTPPKTKLRWAGLKRILRPYFIPTGIRNKLFVVITYICLLGGKVCVVLQPLVLGEIVSRLAHDPPQNANKLIVLYVILNLLPKLLSEIQDVLYVKVWQRAYTEVADITFRHVHSLSLEWHLKKKMGDVTRSIDRGLEAADQLMYYGCLFLLPAIGSAIAAFIMFAVHFKQPEIAAICFLAFVFYLWITWVVTVWRSKYREETNEHDNNVHDLATDTMINFETVKFFTNEQYEADRYYKGVTEYQQAQFKSQSSTSFLNLTQETTIQLAMLGSLLVAAYDVIHDEDNFNVGAFVAAQGYVMTIFEPLSYLGYIYNTIINSMVDLQKLSDLIGETVDVVDKPHAKPLAVPAHKSMAIEFDHVDFRYESQGAHQGIHDLSFTVPAGQTVAFVGPSGSGKTTMSRLLFRFYDVLAGHVRVGGQDVTEVTQKSLRQALGIVPQDTVLFNDTIRANIRYGRTDATDAEVEEAAAKAQLTAMIERMENGWDSMVGERGLKLSGGEKQRVAIARCLLKNPPIVVLDEATSALDNQTEREIQDALACLEGRTTIVIAHRLTTVQNADKIIVLKDGRIAESGKHGELLAKTDGLYHGMWNAQANAAKVNEEKAKKAETEQEEATAIEA